MRFIFKILLWFFGVAVLLLLVVIPLLTHLRVYIIAQADIQTLFQKSEVAYSEQLLSIHNQDVFVRESGVRNDTVVVFVHGAPGSADVFAPYLADRALADMFHMISYDRPGYGRSSTSVISIHEQVETLSVLLTELAPDKKVIVVGHSYGGSTAVFFAVAHPEMLERLVLLAPLLDPASEKGAIGKRFANTISEIPFESFLIAPPFQASAKEVTALIPELYILQPSLQTIAVPTLHVMGDKDFIVSPLNIDYTQTYFNPDYLTTTLLPKMSHLIPQHYPEIIKEALFAK